MYHPASQLPHILQAWLLYDVEETASRSLSSPKGSSREKLTAYPNDWAQQFRLSSLLREKASWPIWYSSQRQRELEACSLSLIADKVRLEVTVRMNVRSYK
jgi:hypothetical protein